MNQSLVTVTARIPNEEVAQHLTRALQTLMQGVDERYPGQVEWWLNHLVMPVATCDELMDKAAVANAKLANATGTPVEHPDASQAERFGNRVRGMDL